MVDDKATKLARGSLEFFNRNSKDGEMRFFERELFCIRMWAARVGNEQKKCLYTSVLSLLSEC